MIFGLAICVVLLFSAFKLRAHQSSESDEGVYLTTFKSVQNGFPIYQQTYLSQPPGFFVAIFPLYSMFGSTLTAARLTIFFYSLIGLVALGWVGWELDSVVLSFIAVSVLYIIPIYTDQILTFHADSLPSTFSTLALASALRFRNSVKWRWLVLSSIFVAIAILVKVDVTILPSIFLVVVFTLVAKPQKVRNFVKSFALFSVAFFIVLLLFTLPFGINNIFTNVIELRFQAAAASTVDPSLFLHYLNQQPQLIVLLIVAIGLSAIVVVKNKDKRFPFFIIFVWVASTFTILVVYHPLLSHHLVLLAVPITLFFSFALFTVMNKLTTSKYVLIPIVLFTVVILAGRLYYAVNQPEQILSETEIAAVNMVDKYTMQGDYIISDDGLVTGVSQRLTPPQLTDLSLVRIGSGNLTPTEFTHNLDTYKPKMIFAWTGKLITLHNFSQIMKQYHYNEIDRMDTYHHAYLLEP